MKLTVIVDGDAYGTWDTPAEMHAWLRLHYPVAYAQLRYVVGTLKCKCDARNANCLDCMD